MQTQKPDNRYRIAQIMMSIGVLEFIGPIIRDTSETHLFNPSWVGHARFHLAWALVFMGLSGVVNIYLIWFRKPYKMESLYISLAWQSCNIFGFWGAVVLEKWYKGSMIDPTFHHSILGINENMFVFIVFTIVLAVNLAYLLFVLGPFMKKEAQLNE